MKKTLLTLTGALLGLALTAGSAHAVKIRVQSVIPAKADEVVMLEDFADTVRSLTNGEVDIEVLPAGAVVGVKETLEAVDKGDHLLRAEKETIHKDVLDVQQHTCLPGRRDQRANSLAGAAVAYVVRDRLGILQPWDGGRSGHDQ